MNTDEHRLEEAVIQADFKSVNRVVSHPSARADHFAHHSSPALFIGCVLLLICAARSLQADENKSRPKVAVFPLSGPVDEAYRSKVGFSLRAKMDRDGRYEVIDGPRMAELAEGVGAINLQTAVKTLRDLIKDEEAVILIWGEVSEAGEEKLVKVKVLDLRAGEAPKEIRKPIKAPTDLRFVAEEILAAIPGVAFEHPSEVAVQNDAIAEELWRKNPNLVVNGDFSKSANWHAIYQSELYVPEPSAEPPKPDKVVIRDGVLAMNLSKYCAENNGMACLSDEIAIEPGTRYRLSFRYKSTGPRLHVFIKGYTEGQDINGRKTWREIYRRQVPPTDATGGKWVTIVDEMNPQHHVFGVKMLKIDLYAYLNEGLVEFDDIVLKAVGGQNRKAKDDALDQPVTRPAGRN